MGRRKRRRVAIPSRRACHCRGCDCCGFGSSRNISTHCRAFRGPEKRPQKTVQKPPNAISQAPKHIPRKRHEDEMLQFSLITSAGAIGIDASRMWNHGISSSPMVFGICISACRICADGVDRARCAVAVPWRNARLSSRLPRRVRRPSPIVADPCVRGATVPSRCRRGSSTCSWNRRGPASRAVRVQSRQLAPSMRPARPAPPPS